MTASSELIEEERLSELEAELATARKRLADVDHRIKNDLQLITSVLALQGRRTPEGPGREAVRSALDRLNAIAAVQRRLLPEGDPAHCELSELVRELVEETAVSAHRADVAVRMDLSPVIAPSRQAAPLALIVGELTRNVYRHAFPERGGALSVSFAADGGDVRLSVRDDGVGSAASCGSSGFGMTLVGLLVQQLRGACELTDGNPGVVAIVRFPQAE